MNKYQDIETICQNIEVVDFNLPISKIASEIYRDLRKRNKLIEFRDILIGATAIAEQISIVTNNKKHFERIQNINML
jgi:predicted nucleic acid-binding protein